MDVLNDSFARRRIKRNRSQMDKKCRSLKPRKNGQIIKKQKELLEKTEKYLIKINSKQMKTSNMVLKKKEMKKFQKYLLSVMELNS